MEGAGGGPQDPREWLDPWLQRSSTSFEDVLAALPRLLHEPSTGGAEALIAAVHRSIGDERHRVLASLVVRALSSADAEALNRLAELARAPRPPRYANLAFGLALPMSGERASAFEREADAYDSARARRLAVETHAALRDSEALRRLMDDEAYRAVADARLPYRVARGQLDWLGMLLWIGPAQYASVRPTYVGLGIATALIWLVFLIYAGNANSWRDTRTWLCVAAVLLGALSTVPTLVLDVWLEEVVGVRESPRLFAGVAYFVASVGLREELCKLAFFLPLAPLVIRRGDPLLMLVVPGCVGLGFAAEENIAYFASSSGGDVAGRFLTANFGHVVDTGLIGFALCRMWSERGRVGDFLLIFVAVVIGHGLYDALIVLPDLQDYSVLSGTLYVAVAYFYFGELRRHDTTGRRRVPLTAVFVFGFAGLLGASLMAVSWEHGFASALEIMIPGTLGAALFVFVFFRPIDEPLLP